MLFSPLTPITAVFDRSHTPGYPLARAARYNAVKEVSTPMGEPLSSPDDSIIGRGVIASAEDLRLVEGLRRGDESVFAMLVADYYSTMLRVASIYVSDRPIAEEVVQETWIAVLKGIGRFEGRSSIKTWIFRILTNRAKTRAQREGRYVPLPTGDLELEADEPAVALERFRPADDPKWPHGWLNFPVPWDEIPEERLLSQETLAYIQRAIDALPPNQREVITLRDVQGWDSGEVCNVLGISETNQRVLLHRARSKVRRALESYLVE